MLDVAVIEEPGAAAVTLDPKRARLLSEMAEPVSAATLAARIGLPRQKVNYHLRALEKHGLVQIAGERKWGGLTERRLVATARSYLISPAALGPLACDPGRTRDRLSASYLIALAARIVREVSYFARRSRETGKAARHLLAGHRDSIPLAGSPRPVQPGTRHRDLRAGPALSR